MVPWFVGMQESSTRAYKKKNKYRNLESSRARLDMDKANCQEFCSFAPNFTIQNESHW